MTLKPEEIKDPHRLPDKFKKANIAPLEDLFYIGYTKSEKIIFHKDEEKNAEYTVQFRTLTAPEIRDIYDRVGIFNTIGAQEIQEKIEILSRSVTLINDMPLILDQKEREEYIKENSTEPTPLDQAMYILTVKNKSKHLIDILYEKYQEFVAEQEKNLEELKKKLKNRASLD